MSAAINDLLQKIVDTARDFPPHSALNQELRQLPESAPFPLNRFSEIYGAHSRKKVREMDTSQEQLPASELVSLSVELASAYVSNNSVPAGDLPKLLSEIHGVLRGMNDVRVEPAPEEVKLNPAVSVKKSVTPDFIVCLEDGKSFKSLKRHLQTKYGLTPQQYRAKWNLPPDYPMVAPNYAAARSAFARASGLGQMRSAQANVAPATGAASQTAIQSSDVEAPARRRGGRRPKAASPDAVASSKPETSSPARSARKGAKPSNGARAKRGTRKAPAN